MLKSKGSGYLGKGRVVACPTCNVPVGEYCVSMGTRGTEKGKVMTTSLHTARVEAAGLIPKHKLPKQPNFRLEGQPAPAPKAKRKVTLAKKLERVGNRFKDHARRSKAAKAMWETRRANARAIEAAKTAPPTAMGWTLGRLVDQAILILQSSAMNVRLDLPNVGVVTGVHTDAGTISLYAQPHPSEE